MFHWDEKEDESFFLSLEVRDWNEDSFLEDLWASENAEVLGGLESLLDGYSFTCEGLLRDGETAKPVLPDRRDLNAVLERLWETSRDIVLDLSLWPSGELWYLLKTPAETPLEEDRFIRVREEFALEARAVP